MLEDRISKGGNDSIDRALAANGQGFRAVRFALKQCVGLQPYPWALGISEKLTASIFLRREAGERVVAAVVEETLEEEIVFESLGILCHVPCRNINIGHGFIDVLSCCDTICIGPESLGQALLNLLDCCISAGR